MATTNNTVIPAKAGIAALPPPYGERVGVRGDRFLSCGGVARSAGVVAVLLLLFEKRVGVRGAT